MNYLGQGGGYAEDLYPWTLNGQRESFAARNVNNPDALYVAFAGANDLADLTVMVALCASSIDLFCGGRGVPTTAINVVLTGIEDAIQAFVDAGAKHVVVPNVPNLGKVPGITVNGDAFSGLATFLSAQYNLAFNAKLAEWKAKWEGVNIIPFNTFSLLTDVVTDPAAFGFSNATDACYSGFVDPGPGETVCADPDAYVFWDKEHPTAAFHALLADRMRSTIMVDILDHLKEGVSVLVLGDRAKSRLIAKLDGARGLLSDDNTRNDQRAADKLENFMDIVGNMQGRRIPNASALALIDGAEKVISVLEGGDQQN